MNINQESFTTYKSLSLVLTTQTTPVHALGLNRVLKNSLGHSSEELAASQNAPESIIMTKGMVRPISMNHEKPHGKGFSTAC
jgi:hypothetical protein